MKKIITTIFISAALFTGSAAFAQNSTIPQVQQWLTSNGYIKAASSTAGVQVPGLGSTGSPCITVGTTGKFGTSTCGGAGNTFQYPLVDTAGSVSLAFGTTTTNIWSNLQTFTNGFISLASSTAQYFNSASSSIDNLLVNTKLGIGTSTPGQGAVLGVNGAGFFSGTVYAPNFYDTALTGTGCVGETNGLLTTSNCVSSIASIGGSLTVSSPTGNVDLSLNMGNSNTWTAAQNFAALSFTSGTGTSLYTGVGASSTLEWFNSASSTIANLRATNATATRLSLFSGACNSSTQKPVVDAGGNWSCGSDTSGAGGGDPSKWATSTTDSTSIFFTGTGNVGIGTSTPGQGAVLGVNGAGFFSGTVYAPNFYDTALTGTGCVGETNGLLTTSNCVSSIASIGGSLTVSSPTGNVDLSLNMGNSNTWTAAQNFAALSFTSGTGTSLYTGVGASSTLEWFNSASSTIANLRATNATATRLSLFSGACNSSTQKPVVDAGGNWSCGSDTSGAGGGDPSKWATSTTDSTSIFFTGTGNVGIGTSSPWARLSIGASDFLAANQSVTGEDKGIAFGNFMRMYAVDNDAQEYSIDHRVQATSSRGIDYQILGGDTNHATARGGDIGIYMGNANFAGQGGSFYVQSGNGDNGGDINMQAGTASSTTGGGGNVQISAGSAPGTPGINFGGTVYIDSGYGNTAGDINIRPAGGDAWNGSLLVHGNGSVVAQFASSTSATTTFSTGIQLTNGTVKLDQILSCNTGNALQTNAAGYVQCMAVTASASAGGINTQLQFNDSTAIAGADLYYIKATQSLGISTSTPYAKLSVVSSSTPQLMLTNMLGGTDQKHWVASTTASGFFHLGTLNDAFTTITPRLTIDTSGRTGIGSTTPWGFLSVVNNGTPPEFVVATTTGANPTFMVNATATPPGPFDSGARVVVGDDDQFGHLLDTFYVKGRINTGEWIRLACEGEANTRATGGSITITGDINHGTVSTSQGIPCGDFDFTEDTAGIATFAQTGNKNYIRLVPGTSGATTAAGDGMGINTMNGFAEQDANTPVFEAVARPSAMGNTSSSFYTLGMTSRSGATAEFAADPFSSCFFAASSTQANWIAVSANNSASLRTDVNTQKATSSVATGDGIWYGFRIETSPTACRFYMRATGENWTNVANITTNIDVTRVNTVQVSVGKSTAGLSPELHVRRVQVWYYDPL